MTELALFIVLTLTYLWGFWGLYVLVMGLYRAYLNQRLNLLTTILGMPFIVVGVIVDVLANFVICSVVFVELPQEWLVTQRLKRYIFLDAGWRHRVALFICEKMLDVFDPTGKHCS